MEVIDYMFWFIAFAFPLTCIINTAKNDIEESILIKVRIYNKYKTSTTIYYKLIKMIYKYYNKFNFHVDTLLSIILLGFAPKHLFKIIYNIQNFSHSLIKDILTYGIFSIIFIDGIFLYRIIYLDSSSNSKTIINYLKYPITIHFCDHSFIIIRRLFITFFLFIDSFLFILLGALINMIFPSYHYDFLTTFAITLLILITYYYHNSRPIKYIYLHVIYNFCMTLFS